MAKDAKVVKVATVAIRNPEPEPEARKRVWIHLRKIIDRLLLARRNVLQKRYH